MKRCRILSMLLTIIMVTCLCATTTVQAKTKNKIAISDKKISIEAGETYQLSIGTTIGVTWSSTDTSIATVDKTGLVTGVSAGTVKVTAKYNGKKYSSKVTVKLVDRVTLTYPTTDFSEVVTRFVGYCSEHEEVDENDDTTTLSIPKEDLEKCDKQYLKNIAFGEKQGYFVEWSDDCKTYSITFPKIVSKTYYENVMVDGFMTMQQKVEYKSPSISILPQYILIGILIHSYINGVEENDITINMYVDGLNDTATSSYPDIYTVFPTYGEDE